MKLYQGNRHKAQSHARRHTDTHIHRHHAYARFESMIDIRNETAVGLSQVNTSRPTAAMSLFLYRWVEMFQWKQRDKKCVPKPMK